MPVERAPPTGLDEEKTQERAARMTLALGGREECWDVLATAGVS